MDANPPFGRGQTGRIHPDYPYSPIAVLHAAPATRTKFLKYLINSCNLIPKSLFIRPYFCSKTCMFVKLSSFAVLRTWAVLFLGNTVALIRAEAHGYELHMSGGVVAVFREDLVHREKVAHW